MLQRGFLFGLVGEKEMKTNSKVTRGRTLFEMSFLKVGSSRRLRGERPF